MTRNFNSMSFMLAGALVLAALSGSFAFGQQPADDPFAPTPAPPRPTPTTQPAPKPADDDPFAPMPTPPRPGTPGNNPAPMPAPTPKPPVDDDPFAPMPRPPVVPQPMPPVVPPAVQPVPTPGPGPARIPVPVNPAPVNPAADGENYGFPAGTTVIIVASPGSRYPWGNTKGAWVPFQYNKQWHLYRSWCQ